MIKTNIIEPGRFAEFIMEGDCVLDEVLSVISSQYRNFSVGILWNFNHGSNIRLCVDDMITIATTVKKHAIHKKTAYVGSVDLEYGILRMYEAYAEMESVSPVLKVFRDRNGALEWIRQDGQDLGRTETHDSGL